MTEGLNGKPAADIRVTVTVHEGQVGVQGNVSAEVCMMVLADGIKCLVESEARKKQSSLVVPSGPVPPPALRRLP